MVTGCSAAAYAIAVRSIAFMMEVTPISCMGLFTLPVALLAVNSMYVSL